MTPHNDLHHLFFKHLAPTSPHPLGLCITHAKGIHVYDAQEREYIDLISGIAVSALGHGHPQLTQVITQQLQQYTHVMVYGECVLQPQVRYAHALANTLGALDCVYFTTSGSEAIEGAMKLAKRVTGRSQFVCFDHAYHGSTQGALSLAGGEHLRGAYRPLLPNIKRLPYNNIKALDAIDHQTAAVFVEPTQGEAGVPVATQEFADRLQKQCHQTGAWLVVDEAQTGLGRTGALWAHQPLGWQPEVLVCAKALGGGLPLGAFIARKTHMEALSHAPMLGHISTFGGHPLSCARGMASFEIIRQNKLWENATAMGQLLAQKINATVERTSSWAYIPQPKIRQHGLLMAWDLGSESAVQSMIKACLQAGLLVDGFVFAPHALRMAPPLTINEEQVCEVVSRLQRAIRSVAVGGGSKNDRR